MGYDLYSKDGSWHRFNIWAWSRVLGLAEHFGWDPMGTLHEASGWSGGYGSNDNQLVTKEDSLNLAKSLRKALAEWQLLISEKVTEPNGQAVMLLEGMTDDEIQEFVDDTPFGDLQFGRDLSWPKYIEQFATFCEKGPFHIN